LINITANVRAVGAPVIPETSDSQAKITLCEIDELTIKGSVTSGVLYIPILDA